MPARICVHQAQIKPCAKVIEIVANIKGSLGLEILEAAAHVRDKVDNSLREESFRHQTFNLQVPLPLAQLAAITVHYERQVGKSRRFPTKSSVHQQVLGGAGLPLHTPEHM